MRNNIHLLCFITIFFSTNSYCLTMFSSFFNTTYSATNPFILTESTEIILDQDIIINTKEALFIIANSNQSLTLTFTQESNTHYNVVISSGNIFNTSSFIKKNQIIIFINTNLLLQTNTTILCAGGTFEFFKNSALIPTP